MDLVKSINDRLDALEETVREMEATLARRAALSRDRLQVIEARERLHRLGLPVQRQETTAHGQQE